MNINIVCVGKIKESFYREAIDEYAKRLSRFAKFSVIEIGEFQSNFLSQAEIDAVKNNEGKKIIEKLKGYVVALDLGGEEMSSPKLSELIKEKACGGISEITFVIGGSVGLSPEVLRAADKKLCFGKFTYPHQLMRVILAEQIYRAFMIAEGSSYHK